MSAREKAEAYYCAHTKLHEATREQAWLKDVVMAAFQDGYEHAIEDAARVAETYGAIDEKIRDVGACNIAALIRRKLKGE